jgi:aerotaxis receptor
MKINLPVTNNEYPLTEQHSIVSTTDLKGITTYANKDFIEICGFEEDELIGKNHNVVRHPDMPVEAFADLWTTVKAGKPWMGIVKNRCKNGDFYWVDAYVTPIYENGQITGYQSVRTRPGRDCVDRATRLYTLLREKKMPRLKLPAMSLATRLSAGFAALLLTAFGALYALGELSLGALTAALLPALAAAFVIPYWLTRPLQHMLREAEAIVDNPVMQQVYIGSTDELYKPLMAIKMLQARLRTVINRITDASTSIATVTSQTAARTEQVTQGILRQQSETDQVATAINEMSATVLEVARNTQQAAAAAHEADAATTEGQQKMVAIMDSINYLSQEVGRSAQVIVQLEEHSNNIGVVLDVIKNIAEQTNLLALNAAIEAARAGEQGRGFAVVADEVRTLAQRTQQSTQEIEKMIAELQNGTRDASQVMQKSCDQASISVEQANQGCQALTTISEKVTSISDMNDQIATAAEEQSAVTEEINRNIVNISQIADQSSQSARETIAANTTLVTLTERFDGMARQFSA